MITRITYTEFLLRFTINKNQYTFASQTITMANRLDIVCNENGCDTKFLKIESLRKHLISVHGFYHEPEQIIEFDSESELQDWISELNNQSVFSVAKVPEIEVRNLYNIYFATVLVKVLSSQHIEIVNKMLES